MFVLVSSCLCAFVVGVLLAGSALAQEAPRQDAAAHAGAQPGTSAQLAEASKEAAGEENAEFKLSPTVRWLAEKTGMSPTAAYWVFILFNFAIVAGVIGVVVKSKAPHAFRARTESIQQSMREAQKASAEANARLSDIETRLGRLDSDIAQMRAQAESEARGEEERIAAAAQEDKQRTIAAAEQEIEALARQARRDLKAYAASLAVELAEKRIQVDPAADRALVKNFAQNLGKDTQ